MAPVPPDPLEELAKRVAAETDRAALAYIGAQRSLIRLEGKYLGKSYRYSERMERPEVPLLWEIEPGKQAFREGFKAARAAFAPQWEDREKKLKEPQKAELAEARKSLEEARRTFAGEIARRAEDLTRKVSPVAKAALGRHEDGRIYLANAEDALKEHYPDAKPEEYVNEKAVMALRAYLALRVQERADGEARRPFDKKAREHADAVLKDMDKEYQKFVKLAQQKQEAHTFVERVEIDEKLNRLSKSLYEGAMKKTRAKGLSEAEAADAASSIDDRLHELRKSSSREEREPGSWRKRLEQQRQKEHSTQGIGALPGPEEGGPASFTPGKTPSPRGRRAA